ncbi:MAG: endolytic transglycosylase MltG [Clostridiaceae bacterium]|nr:endolytic transglycosylase MltG [Clostridiaceae bacterium]
MSSKTFKTLSIIIIIIAFIFIAFLGFVNGFDYVKAQNERMSNLQDYYLEHNTSPVSEDTVGALQIEIPRAASVDDIATILKENELIDNEFLFKVISKFNGFDGQYQSGTHYLTDELSYDEIMFVLTHAPEAITVTIPEGFTYKQLQERLIESGLNIDVQYMDDLVRRPNVFLDYPFVKNLTVHEDREWLLQGYLWADTYKFDSSMDEEAILRVFLNNTLNKLSNKEYQKRADELGLTMDEVITLASVVQAEGINSEMYKISKVFLNRLEADMNLGSCATINYLRLENDEEPVFWVMQSDLDRFQNNPYNTYAFNGLPPGPINNPGIAAIEGVLWPASEKTWENASNYYFFAADGEGNNVFAQTEEEHFRNVEHYSSLNQGEE